MPGPFLLPVGDVPTSCSWQCHRDRNPPSTEPGTDYASAYGTAVAAPFDGWVEQVKWDNGGAPGRAVMLHTDDGSYIRLLHLSSIQCSPGQRVARGQIIAHSGASGFGSDWGYGSHCHVSLWIGRSTPPTPGVDDTQDFARYVGSIPPPDEPPAPEEEEDEMRGAYYPRASDDTTVYLLFSEASGLYFEHSGVNADYNNTIARYWETGSWAPITEAHSKVLKSALDRVRQEGGKNVPSSTTGTLSVTTWRNLAVAAVAGLLLLVAVAAGVHITDVVTPDPAPTVVVSE